MWPQIWGLVGLLDVHDDTLKKDLLLLGLLGQENSLDVGQHTTLSNGYTRQELVQFFVVADGKLQVTGNDTGLLVVTGGITGQLQNFSSQVFHYSCQVHGGTSAYTLSIVALAQKTMDTTHWELKTSSAAAGLGLALHLSALATSRHLRNVSVSLDNDSN